MSSRQETLAELLRRLDQRRVVREAWSMGVALLYSSTPSIERICDDLATGQVELPNLIGIPSGPLPAASKIATNWNRWRYEALRSGVPDLRVRILRALDLPTDNLPNVVTMEHLRATIGKGRRRAGD